jgi:ribosomal protein S18 acetylase RimI-like enzyme
MTESAPTTIHVRSLRHDDNLDDLISLSREFFAEYEAHHPDFFSIDRLTDDDVRTYFSRWLDDEDKRAFVAIADGRIVGYITVYVYSREGFWQVKRGGEVSGLMVQKAYRRRGIATQLLALARAFLAEKRVKYVTLYTAVANLGALAFYRQSGMVPLYTTMLGTVADIPD